MHSTMDPALGYGSDEPARPAWKFQKRTAAQAEPAEADEPPDAPGRDRGERSPRSWWSWARLISGRTPARPATSPRRARMKIVTRGEGVWVYDDEGRRYFDTLSGMWLSNIGHGRREIADAVQRAGPRARLRARRHACTR